MGCDQRNILVLKEAVFTDRFGIPKLCFWGKDYGSSMQNIKQKSPSSFSYLKLMTLRGHTVKTVFIPSSKLVINKFHIY